MKKLSLVLLLLCFGMFKINAQEAGQWYLAGKMSSSSGMGSDNSAVLVDAGFFMKENNLLGLRLGTNRHQVEDYHDGRDSKGMSYGLFYRKYKPVVNRLNMFFEAEASGEFMNIDLDRNNEEIKTQHYHVGGNLGFAFQVNNKINLEIQTDVVNFWYYQSTSTTSWGSTRTDSSVYASLFSMDGLGLGISFIL